MDDLFKGSNEKSEKYHNWNKLPGMTFYSTSESFMFRKNSFYFRAFQKMINRLIETGVMKHLSEKYYIDERVYINFNTGPKVLNINDIIIGFQIWLGCCGISCTAFILELIFGKILRNVEIHPKETIHAAEDVTFSSI